jgi:glycosyltransferase involved in cell wall biosynthesis
MGGVEAVLRHHYEKDLAYGWDSRFLIFFEREQEPLERCRFLGYGNRSTIAAARRKLRAALQDEPLDVAVYHGIWGVGYLADLDRAARRALVLHGDIPDFERRLCSSAAWADGILCVNEPLRDFVLECLPRITRDRVGVVPYPIAPPGRAAPRAPMRERPMVLGFCGRLIVEQKRVDRLPALCSHLDKAGLSYRLEFLGEGPELPWLESQFPDRSRFVFHGRNSGEEYWRKLAGWDAIVFVSDYEGTPIAMLEALSMGVVPIYPRIGSGGDAYVKRLREDLLYEPEDFGRVAQVMKSLASAPETEWEALRSRCRQAVALHVGDGYLAAFSQFLRKVVSLPRISRTTPLKRVWPLDYLSFQSMARISAARRRAAQLLGR